MKDLVERLRAEESAKDGDGYWNGPEIRSLLKEAATEIERREKIPPSSLASEQIFYGYHEDPNGTVPEYDPPHDAPCPFCGKPIHPEDVRTHSLMYGSRTYAQRSYFYRTHRTCDDAADGVTEMDGFILDMIARNGD